MGVDAVAARYERGLELFADQFQMSRDEALADFAAVGRRRPEAILATGDPLRPRRFLGADIAAGRRQDDRRSTLWV